MLWHYEKKINGQTMQLYIGRVSSSQKHKYYQIQETVYSVKNTFPFENGI